jgi:hypothetical protein
MSEPPEATQRQVSGNGRTLVFLGDDVVDLEGSIVPFLGQLAVFATVLRPLPDLPDK